MTKCPFCGALETPDAFPSASQRFSVYKYQCGTEIVFCGSSEGVIEWKCTDGVRQPIGIPNYKVWLDNMTEDRRELLKKIIGGLSRA